MEWRKGGLYKASVLFICTSCGADGIVAAVAGVMTWLLVTWCWCQGWRKFWSELGMKHVFGISGTENLRWKWIIKNHLETGDYK